jgi:hypothetical protein
MTLLQEALVRLLFVAPPLDQCKKSSGLLGVSCVFQQWIQANGMVAPT